MAPRWRAHEERRPGGLLFHYTNQEGLIGIAGTGEMWATCIHYLNDSMEYKYALELATDSIEERQKRLTNRVHGIYYEMLLEYLTHSKHIYIYVISFSEAGDLLSQWRAYSRGGQGFSLGFRFDDLAPLAMNQGFHFGQCIYHEAEQEALMAELIESELRRLPDVDCKDRKTAETALKAHARSFYRDFNAMAPLIKAEGFSEEQEWRLISRPTSAADPRAFVRQGSKFLIPSLSVPLHNERGKLPLHQIIVGPSEYRRLSFDALLVLLTKGTTEAQLTTYSMVPYRGQ